MAQGDINKLLEKAGTTIQGLLKEEALEINEAYKEAYDKLKVTLSITIGPDKDNNLAGCVSLSFPTRPKKELKTQLR